ncbi:M14 family zinc carboxypeptidase [Noviherbaspirillum pedocola]|uniref:DUF2817 domain-containing protein n=1 Tax=Noviherbaspirillum pedocola TaxID=2801341 RepID=A0A934W6G1_9BURK|nr:M14 family zinc carboxypeptidase [Noviherbaspirillum pedocola]MBK4736182.1 DUF2817 domain-containing protein [Noviherbaspirillum pedocola]
MAHAGASSGSAWTKQQWCSRVVARLAPVADVPCQEFDFEPGGGKSRSGVPLFVARFDAAAAPQEDPPRRILLIGGIHGDELTASAIVLKWMRHIHADGGREFVWEVVPLANPDGMLAGRPTRLNGRGVDLNRNFDTANWRTEAPAYWVNNTHRDPRRYPGPAPLSEPESRWIDAEITRFHPDVIISVHAPYALLDYDGPVAAPKRFGALTLNPVGVYPGSLGNYSGVLLGVPVITIELAHALDMPPQHEVERIWDDMLAWIRKHAPRQTLASANAPSTSNRAAQRGNLKTN